MIVYSEILQRGQFETRISKPEFPLYQATQVHGTDITTPVTLPCEADGLLVSWDEADRALAIKTADCMPIAIEGEKGIVFLHAGWKGLANGIIERPEISMIAPKVAIIGPSIQDCCFEVSPDFRANFPHSTFFTNKNDKLFFDLQEEAKKRLITRFPQLEIIDSGKCTCCDKAFHSHRRDQTKERNWNLYIKG